MKKGHKEKEKTKPLIPRPSLCTLFQPGHSAMFSLFSREEASGEVSIVKNGRKKRRQRIMDRRKIKKRARVQYKQYILSQNRQNTGAELVDDPFLVKGGSSTQNTSKPSPPPHTSPTAHCVGSTRPTKHRTHEKGHLGYSKHWLIDCGRNI